MSISQKTTLRAIFFAQERFWDKDTQNIFHLVFIFVKNTEIFGQFWRIYSLRPLLKNLRT